MHIDRRKFVAVGSATAAGLALPSITYAGTINPFSTDQTSKLLPPTLARLNPIQSRPDQARLSTNLNPIGSEKLTRHPMITIQPLPCTADRLDINSSVSIELYHPVPNLYSFVFQAHNITRKDSCIPTLSSSISSLAPRDSDGNTTLRITQRASEKTQSTHLSFDTRREGVFVLAIPTAIRSSRAYFRFTTAHLDEHSQVSSLTHPMPALSSRCAFLSITINESNTGV